jgi:hypothetical protein
MQFEEIKIANENKIPRSELNPPEKSGNAPKFKKDGKSVEIHHEGQNPDGPYREMHPDDHRGAGNDKINHPNKSQPSKINRAKSAQQRKAYWKKEFPQN